MSSEKALPGLLVDRGSDADGIVIVAVAVAVNVAVNVVGLDNHSKYDGEDRAAIYEKRVALVGARRVR